MQNDNTVLEAKNKCLPEGIEIKVNKKGEFDGIMKDGVEVQPGSDEYNEIIDLAFL